MNIALQVTDRIQKLVEIKVIRLHSCKLQYNWINQMCDHNQDNIEICSAQQAETDRELLYTKSWHFEMHADWHACWACMSCYTKSATSCGLHITMCQSQYHSVLHESCLLDLKQPANAFCYTQSLHQCNREDERSKKNLRICWWYFSWILLFIR